MNCPFCKSPARTDWGYHCGTSQDATPQRTNRCREAEVSVLKERIKRLEEVGDKLYSAIYCGCLMDGPCKACSDAADMWDEIKEAKP